MKTYILKKINSAYSFVKSHTTQFILGVSVTVVGGYIVTRLDSPAEIEFNSKEINEKEKPLFQLSNYKISVSNQDQYKLLDTLQIKYYFRGENAVLNRDFEILEYYINPDWYFVRGEHNQYDPKIELVEEIIDNPIIDSINKQGKIKLEIRRRILFDGVNTFNFERSDKKNVGNIHLKFSYNMKNKKVTDSLKSKIFLVK